MRPDILQFPPPHEESSILGHDGSLTPEEVGHLQDLGYVVAHYKSFSGITLVQAYFEGVAKGLIALDVATMKSMDTIRKQLAKLDKGESALKSEDRGGRVDVLSLLENHHSDEPEKRKRRGRPPK